MPIGGILMAQQTSAMRANITRMSPEPEIKDPVDTSPSDIQPPGVDEDEPQSLEEALTG
tara:strand:- start:314 stop:490 length:177 start_codon:yes stop_codon:yes gene_type:complete